jgi:hypothetical protein
MPILKHAEVWVPAAPQDTLAMVHNVTSTLTDQLKEFLSKQITAEFTRFTNTNKTPGKDGKTCSRCQHQDWVFVPPQHLTDTKNVQNHIPIPK